MRSISIITAILFAAAAWAQDSPPPGWPHSVPLSGLKQYAPTRFSQYIVVRDGLPYHAWHEINRNDPSVNVRMLNPNSQSPWKVSGGMESLHGWKSLKLAKIQGTVNVWNQDIPIARAGRALPGIRWSFPDGTVFADLLTGPDGRPFELRMRTKIKGKWRSTIEFEDASAAPKGYHGAGRCATCHEKAGDSQQYGIMIRGNDQCFSFLPTR